MSKVIKIEFVCRKCGHKAEKRSRDNARRLCFSCQPKCREQHFFDMRSTKFQYDNNAVLKQKQAEQISKHIKDDNAVAKPA